MEASASRANLLFKCGYWARSDIKAPPQEQSEHADYGLCTHAIAESLSKNETPDKEGLIKQYSLDEFTYERSLEDARALYEWHTNKIKGNKFHEQKVAFNTQDRSARVLHSPIPRDYSECDRKVEFPGTADLIAVRHSSLTVIDYKTGSTPWEIYKEQLELLGLAASKIYKKDKVYCVVLKVANGTCYPHPWLMERADLDNFENRFVDKFNAVERSEPTPGYHCLSLYCPLAGTCPASMARIQDATGVDMSAVGVDGSIKDKDHFVELYQINQLLTKSKKSLTQAQKSFIDNNGGVELPNGKVYTKKDGSYKEIRVKK